ncbi:hypothetical protein N9V90_00390 [Endozoicomonas sp.]|nr:hypothetical protein [Endozoicomonas sp.]
MKIPKNATTDHKTEPVTGQNHSDVTTAKLNGRNIRKEKVKSESRYMHKPFWLATDLLSRAIALLIRKPFERVRNSLFNPNKGWLWEKVAPPDTFEAKRQVLMYSALAQLPYTMNWDMVTQAEKFYPQQSDSGDIYHAQINSLKKLVCVDQVQEPSSTADNLFKDMRVTNNGALSDPTTGLTAVLVKNVVTGEIVLSFGGTNSGKNNLIFSNEDGDIKERQNNNFSPHVKADVKNYMGFSRPKIYKQAAEIAARLQAQYGHNLVICGHSLGGGLATYASAKTGLKGYGFASAALGGTTLKTLTIEEKFRAKRCMEHYLIKGDPVNNMNLFEPFNKLVAPTIVGKRIIIPVSAAKLKGVTRRKVYLHTKSHQLLAEHFGLSLERQPQKAQENGGGNSP